MRREPNKRARTLHKYHEPADDTAAVCTVTADAEEAWALHSIKWSYNADPTTTPARLTVAFGGVTKFVIEITNGGPGELIFAHYEGGGLHNAATLNEDLVVTLSAGGTGIGGIVNIEYS